MTSITDVAEKAKVSTATVSRVLNKKDNLIPISKETKQKVLKAAEELDYHPNILARSLAQKKSQTIGLIVPNIANPFFSQITKGVEDVTSKEKYNVILCDTDEKEEREIEYLNILRGRWVDSLIFSGAKEEKTATHILDTGKRIPIVGIDREVDGPFSYSVLLDNVKGGYEATKYLLKLGHRRIGLICGGRKLPHIKNIIQREEGYQQALKEYGIKFIPSLLVEGNLEVEGGKEAAKKLLSLSPPPTAIFALNDLMAIGALNYLKEKRIRVPEEISLIGFDDIPMVSLTEPALTTMAQPTYEMGAAAAKMSLKVIAGKIPKRKRLILKATLIIRSSCKEPTENSQRI
ncbi:MAG: LacI family DNA-binding transcriptional regulator [Candidatus Omnitrophica bacterium]|nr:LacI family DNA-binding transcriptional regulator [Candidatus Omnitrophota bacterium]